MGTRLSMSRSSLGTVQRLFGSEAGAQLRPAQIVFEKSPMLQVLVHPDGSWLQSARPALKKGSLAFDSWCPLVYWLSGDVERSLRVGRGLDGSGCTGRLSQW